MSRVFVTGDKHGDFHSPYDYAYVNNFCERMGTTFADYMIVLGDHGIHYDNGWGDHHARKKLAKIPINFIMIRGNHDQRPDHSWNKVNVDVDNGFIRGMFFQDPEAPNILYTEEYGWYTFGGKRCFVIGGAYSVDKYYRLEMQNRGMLNWRWFRNEQLTEGERKIAGLQLLTGNEKDYWILSHTCPHWAEPVEKYLGSVDQANVDKSMELWMDNLYKELEKEGKLPTKWCCGHWHTDQKEGIMHFLYHDIIQLE